MIQERMNLIDSQKEELNQFESELELKIINFNKSAKLYNKLGTFIIGTLVIVGVIFFIYK
ncbi:MAG: hypothetical protein IJH34_13110 [Romboutsia sp.]|nr:hypothetical protein [Romboutsia sp.]